MDESVVQKPILLVEDNPHDADLTLRNGEEALDYLLCRGKHDGRSPCDLPLAVVLDLKLPKVSGLEVLKAVRENEHTRELPVIVLTSSKEQQDTTACHELGVMAYVQK